jgi:hypothetical protein
MTTVLQRAYPLRDISLYSGVSREDDPTMTNLMNLSRDVFRFLAPVALVLAVAPGAGTFADAQRRDVPMTAERWPMVFGKAEFKEHKGKQALVMIAEGGAKLTDLTFRNGTIEFDVDPAGMGAGLGFRMQGEDAFELLYFRPQADCAKAPDCTQYAPFVRKVLLWDVFPQYQAPAPLRQNDWNHVKVVISGRRMRVFVNGSTSPTLAVGSLEGDTQEGQLVLVGPGAFADFTVTPDAVEGLATEPEADPTAGDQRFVRQWQIAPSSSLPDGSEPTVADLPKPSTTWRALAAERGGLVNISRLYGLPAERPTRSLTWLKTTISSTKSQSKKTAIGWSREVWVFVNGQRVYADKNLYQPPTARKAPDGRLSLENGSFVLPLKAGDNEVAVAIANNFYGWGLILRLDDLEGIQLARQ